MAKSQIEVLGVYRLAVTMRLLQEQVANLYGYEMSDAQRRQAQRQCKQQLESIVLIEVLVKNPDKSYVVGTTVGGNGVVVRADEPGVYFADHEWDANTADAVRRALVPLAPSIEEFRRNVVEIDAVLDKIG
jgi:hypothetical protein